MKKQHLINVYSVIFHKPYVQSWKHVKNKHIPTFYTTFITPLISVEILTLNKCKHWVWCYIFWHTMLYQSMYAMLKCDIKSTSENNVESMCQCYIVPFCKFHYFTTSMQGEILCWFKNNSTNFACWEWCVIRMMVSE